MSLTSRQRAHLKGLAHDLAPVVHIGTEGVTEGVVAAVEQALADHELIKVKVGKACTQHRRDVGPALVEQTRSTQVLMIGRVIVLYRPHPSKPTIKLPPPGESGS